ncbi:MAG: TetR family transcriptional regulator [Planctomycetota bacterium]
MPTDPSRRPPQPPAPQQARAKRTQERILAAAEQLLRERLFEEVTVAAIAARAKVAVGTVYLRFAAKEDLLPVLFARHHAAAAGAVDALLEALRRDPNLRGRIRRLVAFTVAYHRGRRGLLRALTMYTRAHPGEIDEAVFRDRAAQYERVAEAVAGDAPQLRQRGARPRLRFALELLNAHCREHLLFGETTVHRSAPTPNLERHLTDTLFFFLCRDRGASSH